MQSYGDHTTFHSYALPNPLEGLIQFSVIIVPLNKLFFPEMLLKYEINSSSWSVICMVVDTVAHVLKP